MDMPNLQKLTFFWHKLVSSLCQESDQLFEQFCIISDEKNNFAGNSKFTLFEKRKLAKVVERCKKSYEEECSKKRRMVKTKSRDGFYSKAVREYFDDLKNEPSSSSKMRNAIIHARRAYEKFGDSADIEVEVEEPSKKRFRSHGAGRKSQAPEFRDELFEWFIGKC